MMSIQWNGERPEGFRLWEEAIREEIGDPVAVTLDAVGGGKWRVSRALMGDSTSILKEVKEALRSADLPIID
jgi:hypothetical protein